MNLQIKLQVGRKNQHNNKWKIFMGLLSNLKFEYNLIIN